jgi:C1A family cysteine protease
VKYKYGYRPDPINAPYSGVCGIIRSLAAAPPKDVRLLSFVTEIYDQGQTSSCVAQAAARCIEISLAQMGVRGTPSRRAIYAMGRIRGGEHAFQLHDEGTIPSSAVAAMSDWGVCKEDKWPWAEADVNQPLPWDIIEKSAAYLVTGWEKIDRRPEAVKKVISSGYPVMFGMPVDEAYENYVSGIYPGLTGKELGGHMQTVLAYEGDIFTVCNSWGQSWGEQGFSRMPASWLFGGKCGDFYALESSPKPEVMK